MKARTFSPWVEPYASPLRESREQVIAFAQGLPRQAWDQPSPLDGWSYKDILAHIGKGNDQVFQKLLRGVIADGRIDTKIFAVDTDGDNARGVEERRDTSAEDLIAELEAAGEEIQELLSQLNPEHEKLQQQDPPFHFEGFLRGVRKENHDMEHFAQLQKAAKS